MTLLLRQTTLLVSTFVMEEAMEHLTPRLASASCHVHAFRTITELDAKKSEFASSLPHAIAGLLIYFLFLLYLFVFIYFFVFIYLPLLDAASGHRGSL